MKRRDILAGAVAALSVGVLRPAGAEAFPDREYARRDGEPLFLDLELPVGAGPFPLVLYVHGGDFVAGNRKGFNRSLAGDILKQGIAWGSVEYRLAPRARFPALTDDIQAAVLYLKDHAAEYRLNPDRLALMGESAGTLLVSYLGATARGRARVAAIVGVCGTHDLRKRFHPDGGCFIAGKFVPNPEPGKPQFCMPTGIATYLGITGPSPNAEALIRRASPREHVHREMPPTLLLHGTHDRNAPFEQSVYMFEAMRAAGAHCDLYAVDGGGHCTVGWDKDPDQARYRKFLLDWLRNKLQ